MAISHQKGDVLCEQCEGNVVNFVKNEQFSARVKHTLENTPTKHIDKTIDSMPKKNVDGYQVKRAKDKVLKAKLKSKFDLYRFIPAKAVCFKIPGLDLARNTLLILLCSVFCLSAYIMLR